MKFRNLGTETIWHNLPSAQFCFSQKSLHPTMYYIQRPTLFATPLSKPFASIDMCNRSCICNANWWVGVRGWTACPPLLQPSCLVHGDHNSKSCPYNFGCWVKDRAVGHRHHRIVSIPSLCHSFNWIRCKPLLSLNSIHRAIFNPYLTSAIHITIQSYSWN